MTSARMSVEVSALGKVAVLVGGKGTDTGQHMALFFGLSVLQELRNIGVDAHEFDPISRPLSDLVREKYNRVFICLDTLDGYDGRLQGWLEHAGIPYTGGGVRCSVLCIDKIISKKVLQASGVRTSPFVTVDATMLCTLDFEATLEKLGGVVFVKPARDVYSQGTSRAETAEELRTALQVALARDTTVIVEKFLPGREFTVAVLDGKVLPPVELMFPSGEPHTVYDTAMKQKMAGADKFRCPCALTPEQDRKLREMVLQGYHVLGFLDYARADVRMDAEEEFHVLEYNPGAVLTGASSFGKAAEAAGFTYAEVLLAILSKAAVGKP